MKSSKVTSGNQILAKEYNDLRDDATIAGNLLAHEQATPDLTLKVETGVYYIDDSRKSFAGGNSPAFAAPSANPRIDLLVINTAGALSIVQGVENASPSPPADPTDKLVICEVFNRVGETKILDADDSTHGYIQQDSRPYLWIKKAKDKGFLVFPIDEGLQPASPAVNNYWGITHVRNVTEVNSQSAMARAMTARQMYLKVSTNTLTTITTTIRLRKNGVDVGPSITIGAGVTGNFNADMNIAFVAGDLITVRVNTPSGGSGTIVINGILMEVEF